MVQAAIGFTFKTKKPSVKVTSFIPPTSNDDGTDITVQTGQFTADGTHMIFSTNFGLTNQNLKQMIQQYREVAAQPEADEAVRDIINESIVIDDQGSPISLNLDDIETISDSVKEVIKKEFEVVLKLLSFKRKGLETFRRWYIDGRLYYHNIIDEKNPSKGLIELRYIDPRFISKIRNICKEKQPNGIEIVKGVEEFYKYEKRIEVPDQSNMSHDSEDQSFTISAESITYVHSGLYDPQKKFVLSHLHKAIKPVNQLRMLEDSVVIYRLARAPERRIFYIDVGNLPRNKAQQYMKDQISRYKNKLIYDVNTGQIRDDRRFMSMMEDFWLPRREGGKGTQIDTLQAGQNLGKIEDVQFFQRKLYRSLNVPPSRIEEDGGGGGGMNFGRDAEISRDELRFTRFIRDLRRQFSELFLLLLKTQLRLKGLMKEDEWDSIKDDIYFVYKDDSHYAQLKNLEILNTQLDVLAKATVFVGEDNGGYFSRKYIKEHVLTQSKETINNIELEVKKEKPLVEPSTNNTENPNDKAK